MEKILWVISRQQVNKGLLDFACYLARLTRSKLTGVFAANEAEEPASAATGRKPYTAGGGQTATEPETVLMDTDQATRIFDDGCERRGVWHDILRLGGDFAEEVIAESRYADLLILGADTSIGNQTEGIPSHFAKKVFAGSQCPVIVPPAQFGGIDEVVFCYDGSPSALLAMKLFTYLLPQFSDKRVHVLEVLEDDKAVQLNKEKILDWLKVHYSQIGFDIETGKAREELFTYFLGKKNLFVVMGAYGRSPLSNLFKESNANRVLRVIDLPLFIAHR